MTWVKSFGIMTLVVIFVGYSFALFKTGEKVGHADQITMLHLDIGGADELYFPTQVDALSPRIYLTTAVKVDGRAGSIEPPPELEFINEVEAVQAAYH